MKEFLGISGVTLCGLGLTGLPFGFSIMLSPPHDHMSRYSAIGFSASCFFVGLCLLILLSALGDRDGGLQ